ncbi:nucleotidyltransferase family protein [Candidatus Woesearchaeota archaeon]|nr:nucleotidyltransferase family protein [Candidatus Woesearchaeota archaeon]
MKTLKEVIRVAKLFEKNNIGYAILRNYKQLYAGKYSDFGDIDVVVRKKDIKKIRNLLKEYKKEYICPLSKHVGLTKYVPEDKKIISFHFHLNGVTGKHITYLKAEPLFMRKTRYKDFYVISDEDLFLLLVFHSLFDKASFFDKYKKDINELSKKNLDLNYIEHTLNTMLSKKNSKYILKLALANKFNELEKLRKKSRFNFIFHSFSNIYQFGKVMKLGAVWKFFHIVFSKADLVSFIGMDGTGKTTATNELIKILKQNKIKNKLVYTGRGKANILPIQAVGQPYKKREKKPSKLLYTLAAPVFAFDLWLRYWFKIWPLRKRRRLVITDRYASDMLLMANVPNWMRKFLYMFFPKPSKIIYLYNKPEILHKRKPEHPIEDMKRQEKLFKDILPKLKPKPVQIKSENIDKTLQKVAEAVIERLYP